jgi:N utilization substance protein B
MINRVLIRLKIVQILYAYYQNGGKNLDTAEKELFFSLSKAYDLYNYLLLLIVSVTRYAAKRIEMGKAKLRPTKEELTPNMKFAENSLAKLIDEDVDFQKLLAKKKLSWTQYDLLLKKVMTSVASKEYYAQYMASPERSLKEDCKLFTKIFEEEFVDSEELEMILEEKSLHWNDDLAYALTWCCRTLKSFADGEAWKMPALYQSEMMKGSEVESDKLFVTRLLQHSFAGYEKYSNMVAESVEGWEKERLFSTDVILIAMGLAEVVNFPTIPVKVTINEYVELSKFYGTPKSRAFVNGLLDRLIQKLVNDGQIVKEGKGLL